MAKDNQLRADAGLSKLCNGDPVTHTRGTDGDMALYGRRVSVHLMVQPAVSALLFGNERFASQGLYEPLLVRLSGQHHRESTVQPRSA